MPPASDMHAAHTACIPTGEAHTGHHRHRCAMQHAVCECAAPLYYHALALRQLYWALVLVRSRPPCAVGASGRLALLQDVLAGGPGPATVHTILLSYMPGPPTTCYAAVGVLYGGAVLLATVVAAALAGRGC
jgi:hypothetical protein